MRTRVGQLQDEAATPRHAGARRGDEPPFEVLMSSAYVIEDGRPRPQPGEGLDDTGGDSITGGDAAENVDEHAADLVVRQHDLQRRGHRFRGGTTADVEEVRGLLPAVLLTRAGHDVEG